MVTGYWLLAAGAWQLVTGSKISVINRGFGSPGAYNLKLAATGQGQETSSQMPVASGHLSRSSVIIDYEFTVARS